MKQPNDHTPSPGDVWRIWLSVALGVGIYLVLRWFDWFVGHDVRSSYWFLP